MVRCELCGAVIPTTECPNCPRVILVRCSNCGHRTQMLNEAYKEKKQ